VTPIGLPAYRQLIPENSFTAWRGREQCCLTPKASPCATINEPKNAVIRGKTQSPRECRIFIFLPGMRLTSHGGLWLGTV
jgi:hypothetical protein